LGKSERERIHNTIGPREAQRFKLIHQVPHGPTTLELEHERHILKEQPSRAVSSRTKSPKDLANQLRLMTSDSSGATGLAQVLARESG
jgi:hypothetical protein